LHASTCTFATTSSGNSENQAMSLTTSSRPSVSARIAALEVSPFVG
jgi:hypothetical protein